MPETFAASVWVDLKPGVLDPQGEAVANGLRALGFEGVEDVRVGRWIAVRLQADSPNDAEEQVRGMCERLLANPVIERYGFDVARKPDPVGKAPAAGTDQGATG